MAERRRDWGLRPALPSLPEAEAAWQEAGSQSKRTFLGGTIATADLGAMEMWSLPSFSPLIDLLRAWYASMLGQYTVLRRDGGRREDEKMQQSTLMRGGRKRPPEEVRGDNHDATTGQTNPRDLSPGEASGVGF